MPINEPKQLAQAIAALEGQRPLLGDAVVDASIAALGEKLAALTVAPRDEQRKLVTVLFADLAGWTAMSESMDAEDLRAVQQAYFAAVTPPILARGGRVEKYIGDAVLAVFGVPLAREDDPERAVHTALDMQTALAALPVETLHATSLRMRIGVHTGPVLATVGQRADDFVVTGDTVNLAARLQATAPPGGVLISHDTWRHVQGLFDLEPQKPLIVKGKAEPLQTYRVDRARPRPFRREARGVAGVETRMVGREAELLTVQNILQDVIADGELRLVTVVGEGGVGKSRLLGEFEQWVAGITETVWYFKGRASPDSERQPYGLLRDMLAARFGISESDPPAEVRRKLEAGLSSPFPVGEPLERGAAHGPGMEMRSAHLIGHLVGYDFSDSLHLKPLLDDPQQLREQALTALAAYFKALAAQGPILTLLEDLHWADNGSLDALSFLAQTLNETPLFVLAAARPELYERRPHWGEGWASFSRLDLRPLSKRASRQLVNEILQHTDLVPESLQDLIVTSADGNPFFVEELIKMLVDDSVIDTGGEHWRIDLEKLRQTHIPATLTGVLQARLDRLPAEERTILQQAAVVGPVFWDLAVLACSGALEATDPEAIDTLRASLKNLRSRELVFRRETSAFDRALEHTFKHAILRDVTYETVLKRLRQVYHGLVADWLIAQTGERSGEFVGLIADHLEGAGRDDEAVRYLLRAGDQARLVYAHGEAVVRYERALAMLEAKGDYDEAARTCMRLGITHQNASDYASARLAFDRGFALEQRASEVLKDRLLPPAPHALRVDWPDPQTLDPTLCTDTRSEVVIRQLFSGLVEFGHDFGIEPDVAQSWQISDDGCTYVFYLRDDTYWSDGTPVTAADFVYAWQRRLDPARPTAIAAYLFDVVNARAYHQGDIADARQLGVRAAGKRTLVVELEEPADYFLQLLANVYCFPTPRPMVERWGERWTDPENIVSNGPFLLESWQTVQSLVLTRNPRYHGRLRGNVARVHAFVHSNWFNKLAMYEADELDVLFPSFREDVTPLDWMRARQRHAEDYTTGPGWASQYMGLNASKPPFDDPRVRRALVLATDREAFTNTVYQGYFVPATGGFVPPELPGHSPDIGLPYDPVQARQLLAEAGYPGGKGFPVVEALGREWSADEMGFLRQQWSDNLGIEVSWLVADNRTHTDQLSSLTVSLFLAGWAADYPDPDNFLRVALMNGPVAASWRNETFDKLVRQAKVVGDQQKRLQLYRQADRILVQEAVIMPLSYARSHRLRKPWLTMLSPDGDASPKDIIIQPH